MKKPLIVLFIVLAASASFFLYYRNDLFFKQPQDHQLPKTKPLEKYTIENLANTTFSPSKITIGEVIKQDPKFTSRYFYFTAESKKVSGLVNIPTKAGTYPIIEMNRGYIDKDKYQTGVGTQHTAEVFAQNGFITLAPDFLGFGQSDSAAVDTFEDRFQTCTTVLSLLASLPNLNQALATLGQIKADPDKVFLWGHSNGGQITLTVLEITGKPYPTVLWAPVGKPFPYSILYYTDDSEDHGKALRKVLANFEQDYDVENYSLTNFLNRIKAPIQLHQGTADESVPISWSNLFVQELKKQNIDVTYFTYPDEDHNFDKGSWNTIVERNIDFYRSF